MLKKIITRVLIGISVVLVLLFGLTCLAFYGDLWDWDSLAYSRLFHSLPGPPWPTELFDYRTDPVGRLHGACAYKTIRVQAGRDQILQFYQETIPQLGWTVDQKFQGRASIMVVMYSRRQYWLAIRARRASYGAATVELFIGKSKADVSRCGAEGVWSSQVPPFLVGGRIYPGPTENVTPGASWATTGGEPQ